MQPARAYTVSLLAIPLSAPDFSFQRKPIRPRRQLAHQLAQLLDGTEFLWDLGYELVMHMQYDRIAANLDVEDSVRELTVSRFITYHSSIFEGRVLQGIQPFHIGFHFFCRGT